MRCFILAAAAGAQTLARIIESGTLTIGFRADAVPLSYIDETNNPAGYSVYVCSEVAQAISNQSQIDLGLEFVTVTTKDRFEKVASGEVDMLCGAATIAMERRELVDFTIPTYVNGAAVILSMDADANFGALAGKKIGVRSGTTTDAALNVTLEGTDIDAEVITFDDQSVGMGAMSTGEISAYFADQSSLLFMNASLNNGRDFKVMNRLLTFEKHGIAVRRGDTEFRFLMDGTLSGLYGQGVMENAFRPALRALYLAAPILP